MSKVINPNQVKNYRPVACCNTPFKIIAKVLSGRLQGALIDIIDPAQGAFVQNRSMAHNILLSQEFMLHYTRQHISPRCTIKLDIHKAYDNIQWGFLDKMLKGLNFPERFRSWLHECFSTPTYLVVVIVF